MENEGGYVLHEVEGDRGGQTYAGIARKFHPDWVGWKYIDDGNVSSQKIKSIVKSYYEENFWVSIAGYHINNHAVAESIFDFAVNAGVKTASRLAQSNDERVIRL